MTAAGWMSPLARAERMLTTRLLHLERQLPDDPEAPAWDRYVSTVTALTRVLDRIRPLSVAGLPTTTRALEQRLRKPTAIKSSESPGTP